MSFQERLGQALGKRTVEECRRSYEARLTSLRRLVESGQASKGYVPSDERDDERDVAFGVTRSGRYLDAKMVESDVPVKLGLVSHSALLVGAGLSKSLDDPKPTDDYAIRGIVKAKLNDRVIFWEDGYELLRKHTFVRTAIQNLLDRKIIRDDAEIYGSGERIPVALAWEARR